ncbi:MAG: ribosomal-protein-alanine N-acetyltransferase [Candidatus Marinimicrobia bacterium]|nr:ribosomal-protein-alanine N-acetyltransferase [Candidatus Neomarinimicrobiota bacterium]
MNQTALFENLLIRQMEVRDLSSVLQIEETSFDNPWRKEHFLINLKVRTDARSWVASLNQKIVGFIIAWYISASADEEGESHIHNIAVSPEYRRHGIGRSLLLKAVQKGTQLDCSVTVLEVRESNYEARSFYRDLGFYETGIRPNYYQNEDAVVMEAKSSEILKIQA